MGNGGPGQHIDATETRGSAKTVDGPASVPLESLAPGTRTPHAAERQRKATERKGPASSPDRD